MFDGITAGLSAALSKLRGQTLTEANIRDGMAQVKRALLEADVHYDVATNFIKKVTEQAIGERVLKAVRPDEQFIGVVHNELVNLMGPVDHSLHLRRDSLNKLMLCGLQGSGKTTTCGKLARMLRDQGWSPMLVAADLQRPAAIEQLKVIGQQLGVPVYAEAPEGNSPVKVCQNGLKAAQQNKDIRVVIFDTAGRLHVDNDLMQELTRIDQRVGPDQVLLVSDAMTGQDAVNSAKAFNDALELDGVILSKLDGDTRGGAALSIKEITGVPIKFIGVGEQLDRLEPFHPDRMAGRILGMGDIVTLVERAREQISEEEALAQQKKLAAGKFGFNEFLTAMRQMRRMGSLSSLMKMIPGFGSAVSDEMANEAELEIPRIEAMIFSMTPDEREHPDKIDRSRRHRIARGAGVDPADVNRLIKDFGQMSTMMQKMASMSIMDRMKMMTGGGIANLFGTGQVAKVGTGKRGPADAHLAAERKKKARKDAKKQRKRNR